MKDRLTVVFLIDALGWEVVEHFGFCGDLLEVRRPLNTVLGYSSAAMPSLFSGTAPSEHGVWSMYRLAGSDSTFHALRHLPSLPHALDWRARRLIRRMLARRGTIENYYDLYEIPLDVLGNFDVALKTDPYSPGGLRCPTVFDDFVREGYKYRLWYYRSAEADNMDALLKNVGGDDDILFLYTAELDALMHRTGISAAAVGDKLKTYEAFLEKLFERAEKASRAVEVHVLSDHGMTDVNGTIDPWGELARRGLRLKRDYLAFYDSTMARFWCDDTVRKAVGEIAEESGKARVLTDDELRELGCYFEDRSYGNTIMLANPGIMVVPSFMGGAPVAAMHGYSPHDRYSVGCFLSNLPSSEPPQSILDFRGYLSAWLRGGKS